MKTGHVKQRARAVALLLVVALFITLTPSGCTGDDIFRDFITVNADHELISEANRNEDIYTYRIKSSVKNESGLPLLDATIKLNVPEDVTVIEGDLSIKKPLSDSEEKAHYFVWTVSVTPTTKTRNIKYSVSVSSKSITPIYAYNSLFVKGKNSTKLDFSSDTWSFNNYEAKPIKLTPDDKKALLYNLSADERKTIKTKIRRGANGQCYGMAVTAILAKTGRLNVSRIQNNALNLHDVSKSKESKSTIAYYYLTQFVTPAKNHISAYKTKDDKAIIDDLVKMSNDVETGGAPALLCFRTVAGGHAVVAYGHQKCDKSTQVTVENKTFSNRILIYDNNKPNNFEYLYYTNSGDWLFMYDKTPAVNKNGKEKLERIYASANKLLFACNSMEAIDMNNLEQSGKSVYSYIVSYHNENLEIGYKGKAQKVNGLNTHGATDLVADYDIGDNAALNIDIKNEGEETPIFVKSQNPTEDIDISTHYNNFYMTVLAKGDDTAKFNPDGGVGIQGETSDFQLSVTANEEYAPLPWHTISVAAAKGKNPALKTVKDGYVLSCENLSKASIYAETDYTAEKLTLRTDANTVFITQNDERLCVKVDENGDGKYETLLATGSKTQPDRTMDSVFFWDNWQLPIVFSTILLVAAITAVFVFLLSNKKKNASR